MNITPALFKKPLYIALVLSIFLYCSQLLFYATANSDWHDFDVYYGAAKAALIGKSIYIIVGKYHLPFWYLPWTAWFYIPFAIWTKTSALLFYKCISLLIAIFIINSFT